MGAAMGGALGGVGGWAVAGGHSLVLGGMFAAGVGVAAATNSWDSFTGGLVGSVAGTAVGNGVVNSHQFRSWKTGNNYSSNAQINNLSVQQQSDETSTSTNTYGKFTISVKNGGGSSGMGASGNGWGHAWGTLEDNSGTQTSYGF